MVLFAGLSFFSVDFAVLLPSKACSHDFYSKSIKCWIMLCT